MRSLPSLCRADDPDHGRARCFDQIDSALSTVVELARKDVHLLRRIEGLLMPVHLRLSRLARVPLRMASSTASVDFFGLLGYDRILTDSEKSLCVRRYMACNFGVAI